MPTFRMQTAKVSSQESDPGELKYFLIQTPQNYSSVTFKTGFCKCFCECKHKHFFFFNYWAQLLSNKSVIPAWLKLTAGCSGVSTQVTKGMFSNRIKWAGRLTFKCPSQNDLGKSVRLNLVSQFKSTGKQGCISSYFTNLHGCCRYIFIYNNTFTSKPEDFKNRMRNNCHCY